MEEETTKILLVITLNLEYLNQKIRKHFLQ